jgi:hypothetical protein
MTYTNCPGAPAAATGQQRPRPVSPARAGLFFVFLNFKQRIQDRHCEPTGRLKAPPDDRLRKQSKAATEELDCFVATLLAMTTKTMLHLPPSYPRRVSSTSRALDSIADVGILDARRSLSSGAHSRDPVAGMTDGYDSAFSRHHLSESCKSFRPKRRGRREDRVRAAPAVSCAKAVIKNAHEHTGSAEAVRPSLRNGVTAYFVLSPVRP